MTYQTYKITCTVTEKIYFGYTSMTLAQRFTKHAHERRNTIIKNSIAKYGKDNHTIEHISDHSSHEEALAHECLLIQTHQTNVRRYPNGNGMNLTDGGEGGEWV